MDKLHYEEMVSNLNELMQKDTVQKKNIYLFGHCNATEELADLLLKKELSVVAILDNNPAKHGNNYRGILIKSPENILKEDAKQTMVCIAARAYEAMAQQLNDLGYAGQVHKLVDYNSYAEYSLSEDAIAYKRVRVERGIGIVEQLEKKYPKNFKILCPFSALGDIYIMMSYLPYFLQNRGIKNCVITVIGRACAQVVKMFGDYSVEVFSQKEMDEVIQACLYTRDKNAFIAHQDRPYVVNLYKALYEKCIPLEQMYCCGVFSLPEDTIPYKPACLQKYKDLSQIEQGKAVIFSPYAKSVTALPDSLWQEIVDSYLEKGYQCFTNVVGDEVPLERTMPISPSIAEIQSVVERAGTFIGIRSGICDVIKMADCQKIALYPDYNYCDTKWKAIDMYSLSGWENIVVKDGFQWTMG